MAKTFTHRLDGIDFDVELKGRAVMINGKLFKPEISGETITVEGTSHKIEIEGSRVFINGIAYPFETEGLEDRATVPLGGPAGGTQSVDGAVTAIMPGLIIKVKVSPGDEVATGDVLVILEAMKMESEICAPKDGQVKSVDVAAGDNVAQNQVLVVIE